MTHIPDEAVKVAIRSFESTENNCETYQDMRKAISSAIQKICENIDFYDIKNELFGEMSRRFKNEKYIWESWKDFYPNPEYLPVDDTEIGVEFAFNFLERHINKSEIAAALPYLSAPCAVGKSVTAFGKGEVCVDTGEYYGAPVVLIYADKKAGVVGGYVPKGEQRGNEDLKAGELAFTFPTHEQAKAVADALCNAITKPVDVAAVRKQVFEEGFENGVEQSLNALDAYDDITRNEAEQGIRKLKPDYRALSAEPVQGCGND